MISLATTTTSWFDLDAKLANLPLPIQGRWDTIIFVQQTLRYRSQGVEILAYLYNKPNVTDPRALRYLTNAQLNTSVIMVERIYSVSKIGEAFSQMQITMMSEIHIGNRLKLKQWRVVIIILLLTECHTHMYTILT